MSPLSLHRYGNRCECESTIDNPSVINKCKRTNTSNVVCEGNGECVCNECKCDLIEVKSYSI